MRGGAKDWNLPNYEQKYQASGVSELFSGFKSLYDFAGSKLKNMVKTPMKFLNHPPPQNQHQMLHQQRDALADVDPHFPEHARQSQSSTTSERVVDLSGKSPSETSLPLSFVSHSSSRQDNLSHNQSRSSHCSN